METLASEKHQHNPLHQPSLPENNRWHRSHFQKPQSGRLLASFGSNVQFGWRNSLTLRWWDDPGICAEGRWKCCSEIFWMKWSEDDVDFSFVFYWTEETQISNGRRRWQHPAEDHWAIEIPLPFKRNEMPVMLLFYCELRYTVTWLLMFKGNWCFAHYRNAAVFIYKLFSCLFGRY